MEKMKNFLLQVLRGVGQIMLQGNALSGILFLAGIAWGSPLMAIVAFFAAAMGTATAIIFKFDREKITQGIYGFNAALVGVALLLFFKFSFPLFIFISIGAVLSTLLHHLFIKKNIPAFTFSFVVTAWILIYFLKFISIAPSGIVEQTPLWHSYLSPLRGFGQIIFQTDPISGLLFIAGIFVNSSVAGIFSIGAAIISTAAAYLLLFPINNIELGLFSYNAILCAIVFAHFKFKNLVLASVAVMISVFITQWFLSFQLIALTFPFVAATWIVLGLQNVTKKPLLK